MKKILTVLFFVYYTAVFAQPAMDGIFEGEGVWGTPVAVADGIDGWNGVGCDKLYVITSPGIIYFAATLSNAADSWNRAAFVINVEPGGGTSDPWGSAVTYAHANLPDFVIVGRPGDNWGELRRWNGTDFNEGSGINIVANFINWSAELDYFEGRLGYDYSINGYYDVQFYISGNNQTEHGVFDSVPDDDIMLSWNNPTILDNYHSSSPVPVELTSFTATTTESSTILKWETATEVNNYGFDIEASTSSATDWTKIGFVEGHGNSNSPKSYNFVASTSSATYFRLKQIDTDGGFEYSDVVEVASNLSYKLAQNHPNPFNPTTQISFSIPEVAKVQVTVYNALGQQVAELANREFAAGNHSVNFNASGLSSGLYFYKLNSANFNETRKMMLVK